MESGHRPNFFDHLTQFETLVNYVFYVNYKKDFPHHKISNVNEDSNPPYLWTKDAGYCIPIAFIYKKEGIIQKIALYHSVSEHLLDSDESKNFKKFLKSFLRDIDDPENIEIVMSFNPLAHTKVESDCKLIKNFVNLYCFQVCENVIPNHNFYEFKGSDTFFITVKGDYGVLPDAAKNALETIKEEIKKFLLDNRLYLVDELQPILNMIYHSGPNSIETLERVKQAVGSLLLKAWQPEELGTQESDKTFSDDAIDLFKQIVAWDLILNDVSQHLYQKWLLDNGCYVASDSEESSLSQASSDDEQHEPYEEEQHSTQEDATPTQVPINKKY